MYKLVSCCLLFIGSLNPLLSLPVLDSRQESLQLLAPEDVRSTLDELERASLLQMLPEMSGAETGEGLRNAFSGQDPKLFLSDLLSRIRKQSKKRGPSSECFWKYCV
ncbi:urotensin-2 [Oryx dammah]|uniref:urotensin-2 n=1 Tax=Oryx dammah TaxID=59534 RepID=UPI001A9B8F07|nr:urotensin-2 [Oryx dammah]